eukprot:Gregarina_sp_Poly_1__833@NODE_119_length_13600_cov_173_393926_g106_i0_p1_GENE_NODE_119_length_13600_cov_173_393926_g106_i0NODE_119_length_13600_cov_173_393926_g106_i0_p1_ORF_typecomplete_len1066_score200_21Peptidase_C48/PF02902_19/2_4e11_NODE_119_length_13600_cov_173_393926_g106_i061739370
MEYRVPKKNWQNRDRDTRGIRRDRDTRDLRRDGFNRDKPRAGCRQQYNRDARDGDGRRRQSPVVNERMVNSGPAPMPSLKRRPFISGQPSASHAAAPRVFVSATPTKETLSASKEIPPSEEELEEGETTTPPSRRSPGTLISTTPLMQFRRRNPWPPPLDVKGPNVCILRAPEVPVRLPNKAETATSMQTAPDAVGMRTCDEKALKPETPMRTEPVRRGPAVGSPADISQTLATLEDNVLRKYRPLGAGGLVFPDLGGSSPLGINVSQVGGHGVGKVMVMFEDMCLKILHYRLGWSVEDCRMRLPELRAVRQRLDCVPFFLRSTIDQEMAASEAEILSAFLDTIDCQPLTKQEPEGNHAKPSPVSESAALNPRRFLRLRQRNTTTSEKDEVKEEGAPDFVQQYPDHLVSHYLDGSKVIEGHPQRYEAFNKKFDFITRSLLWCLRPTSYDSGANRCSAASLAQNPSFSRQPWERSVELNADVMNVWMAMMQEWGEQIYQERLRRWNREPSPPLSPSPSPSVLLSPGPSSAVDSSCNVIISSASTDELCEKDSRQPNAAKVTKRDSHEFLSGYSLSSDEERISASPVRLSSTLNVPTPKRVKAEAKQEEALIGRRPPKRSLFLSTDFMTTFENALMPVPSSLSGRSRETPAELENSVPVSIPTDESASVSVSVSVPSNRSTNNSNNSGGAEQTKLEDGELSAQETGKRQVSIMTPAARVRRLPPPSRRPGPETLSRALSHKLRLLQTLLTASPMNSFEFACERVFRFFQRRKWNPWDYDFVCWPINYLTAHWVLLTVDISRRELVWSDSYRRWYLEVVEKRVDNNARPAETEVATTDVPLRKADNLPYDLSRTVLDNPSQEVPLNDENRKKFIGIFGHPPEDVASSNPSATSQNSLETGLAQSSQRGFSQESSPPTTETDHRSWALKPDSVRLRYSGWMHFVCVEEYLKYDFKRRKSMGIDLSKHSEIEKAFEDNVPWKRVVIEHLPQQAKLSLDCGVYSAHFARCIGQFGTTDEIDFNNDNIDSFRAMMAVLIGRGELPKSPKELLEEAATIAAEKTEPRLSTQEQ